MVNRTGDVVGSLNTTVSALVWTPLSSFNVFMLVSGLCTNLSVILLFVRNSALRTPFTIYLVNLLLANTFCSIVYYPLEILNDAYTTWWAGSFVCTLYQYASPIAQSAMCNAHVLIAMNRLWAVTFTVSYRQHSKETAVAVCVGMWVYVHVLTLPGLVLDAMYYRLPEETNGCQVNTDAMKAWWTAFLFILFNTPELIVLLAYVAICYQTLKRRGARIRPGVQSKSHPVTAAGSTNMNLNKRAGLAEELSRVRCNRFLCWKVRTRRREHGFLMLTLMTSNILICYTPANLYYSVLITQGINLESLFLPAVILYELNAVLDPVWFVLALPDFRAEFRTTCFRRWTC